MKPGSLKFQERHAITTFQGFPLGITTFQGFPSGITTFKGRMRKKLFR